MVGAKLGGGERDAHTIQSYAVPSTVFPASTHYVALGHLHRRQAVVGPCPVHYSGSPLAVDFGEEENMPSVTIVDGRHDVPRPGRVTCRSRRRCRCVRSGARSTSSAASTPPRPGWLRVYVRERPRAGLREAVQDMLPNALEVRIDPDVLAELDPAGARAPRQVGRTRERAVRRIPDSRRATPTPMSPSCSTGCTPRSSRRLDAAGPQSVGAR